LPATLGHRNTSLPQHFPPPGSLRRVHDDRSEQRANIRFDNWRLNSVLRQLIAPDGLVVPLSTDGDRPTAQDLKGIRIRVGVSGLAKA